MARKSETFSFLRFRSVVFAVNDVHYFTTVDSRVLRTHACHLFVNCSDVVACLVTVTSLTDARGDVDCPATAMTAAFALHLGASILKPDLDLRLGERQTGCQLSAPLHRQVATNVELCRQDGQLVTVVVGPRASPVASHSSARSSSTAFTRNIHMYTSTRRTLVTQHI